ncbi:hypothetical protein [Moraxella nasicaprae]|uniref:Uncharacterized protein n=1 Tax=Moraxella nasicaprae TaxID=2904122 RepID=A0ABY6F335_9GAMM|nr:hypothetical protein [Moraxella nasicaprae]UXZ04501.1 hypothetical protein LU297_07905 [Moraxella nasicaprae]
MVFWVVLGRLMVFGLVCLGLSYSDGLPCCPLPINRCYLAFCGRLAVLVGLAGVIVPLGVLV